MSDLTEIGTVYKFVGREGQYLNAVPARNLKPQDLMDLESREGITEDDIRLSGLYEPTEWAEVEPFCGAPLEEGGRCREPVAEWGLRCERHGALTVINGIGQKTAVVLRSHDVGTTGDLAALDNDRLERLAGSIWVSVPMLKDWREQAREIEGGE